MKITVNKSAKRVLSIALALVMLVGTLFTANIGNITADAETAPIAEGTIDLLEFGSYLTEMGSTSTYWDTKVADNGETGDSWENAIIIDSAEEFVYLSKKGGGGAATAGKYYKVADGIAGFDLSAGNLDFDGTLADNLEKIKNGGKKHSGDDPGFQGNFDGNGATVYGAVINGSTYAAVFPHTDGEVTIKNLNVKLCYFKATAAAAAIIGHHNSTTKCTVTVENCSVTDCYIETTGKGYGQGVGAIIGYGASAPSYTGTEDANNDGKLDTIYQDCPYIIKNCFVNLDEQYFVSPAEDGVVDSGERACHGGVMGVSGSNALTVSDCIVLGITPYATMEGTSANDVQHSGLESHFANVYTDAPTGKIAIGGSSLGQRDFTGKVFQLTPAQMQGDAAVSNMSLSWFSVWTPGEEGEYPTFVKPGEELGISFWSGAAASEFAGGTGTKEDPFIIETADQLYYALSHTTQTATYTENIIDQREVQYEENGETKTKKENYDTGEDKTITQEVAGCLSIGEMKHQEYDTAITVGHQQMVPVYEPYYYKVADGIDAFYLNNVYGNETLDGAKAMGASSNKKDWKPGKSFVGNLDGNGVTIYGMYNASGTGLVHKLDGSATVKNINFNACYSTGSGNVALLTTNLGSYSNDSTIINVANISVRNSYIATSRNITLTQRTDNGLYDHNSGPAIISTASTCENITVSNCLYDGKSCERAVGATSEISVDMIGGIYSGNSSVNNFTLNSCVSLGAPAVNEVYVNGKEVFYNRYDTNQGFPVHFYSSYSDMPLNAITTAYPNKYDKLKDIERIGEADTYEMFDMPKLAWNNWAFTKLEDGRVIPMPTVNAADEIVGSYVSIIGAEAKSGKYASVGPYPNGTNPYTYTLKGSGTEADPFIIETDVQLARAIATGGMNLNDKLYYKLGNDIDVSGGTWINQDTVSTSTSAYTYKPFSGVLDGDGHTVTGLSAGDSEAAGLIPVLDGGTVKNLHIRDARVVSPYSAGVIVGEALTPTVEDAQPEIINCSVENATVNAEEYYRSLYFIGYDDIDDPEVFNIQNCYFIGTNGTVYVSDNYHAPKSADEIKSNLDTSIWYIGGKEGSLPRLVNHAAAMEEIDIVGDGKADDYGADDLAALRNKLLRKDAYANIYGDVSRNGTINIADLAVLQRIIADRGGWADITDGFWANVDIGKVDIYYGENDNYDAARKLELYFEEQTGADIIKHVSSSKGTVEGASSDSSKVYLHANDTAETPDGKLDVIVGTLDNVDAYKSNTVATASNTYAVTYDSTNHVIWIQGENFTAVEQAVLDFIAGSDYKTSTIFSCGSTELEDYKKPVTVKLDTDYNGELDTEKTLYYAWGDEFEGDTIDTNNWTHNSQQSEMTQGKDSVYWNQEIAPIKDYDKMLVVENGRLSMKRGYDSTDTGLGTSTNGTVALDVTAGEENGYTQWLDGVNGDNAIDADGSDVYFSSGKIITDRGMLYKQGYIEFQGQLPADGHAFPAWWLMGRPAQAANNNGYDNSLYSKVYKINENWNGSNTWDQTNLDTYKYQIPSAIYEIDMIEVMQHPSRYGAIKESTGIFGDGTSSSYHSDSATKGWTKAVGWYQINSTIHKWWNNGVYNGGTSDNTSDDKLYIHDWDNYQVLGGITNSNFSTTSTAGSWIHNIGSTILDFGSPVSSSGNVLTGYKYYNGDTTSSDAVAARNDLQATRKYGFSWNTDGVSKFEATLYVYNEDGTLRTTVPIASGVSGLNAFLDGNKKTEANGAIGNNAGVYSDAKVFNQYMYILFDNKFYSSNNLSGNTIQFTDLLTAAGLTSLEIDYVRVYQEDGARDIVTKETENFNNANHFGY